MSDFQLLLLGALLAIVGGYVGDEIRAWRERVRELKAIKITLADELGEIEATIKNMHEVWEQTKFFGAKYISELLSGTSAYDGARPRLFLISDDDLRKKLVAFYKKLKDQVKKSEGRVGTLADTEDAKAEQVAFEAAFQILGTEAKHIREKLEKLEG